MSSKFKGLEDFLAQFEKVKKVGNNEFAVRCPAHADKNPSLNISLNDTKILINCKAGCQVSDIVKALNLTMADLFIGGQAVAKQTMTLVETYVYKDASGKPLTATLRYEPKNFRQGHYASRGKLEMGLGNTPTVLYHLPEMLIAKADGDTIYFVEGEKDADKLWDYGFVATTNPMGAGKWKPQYTQTLEDCKVVIIPDKDKAGKDHAEAIAKILRGKAKSIKIIDLPDIEGIAVKDVYDWFVAGGDEQALRELVANTPEHTKLPIITAKGLMAKHFEPVRWIVPTLIPSGVSMLGGKPKVGKSWLDLDVAISVAGGGMPFGSNFQCDQRPVLLLSLEDGERRLQGRLRDMDRTIPDALTLAFKWQRLDTGGMEDIDEWAAANNYNGLIIIDTLKRVRPTEQQGKTLYGQDYDAVAPLLDYHNKHNGIDFWVNHHLNKREDKQTTDVTDLISGSTGLTGALDNVLILQRRRGETEGTLDIISRDAGDRKIALEWQAPFWIFKGDATQYEISKERLEILDYLAKQPDSTPKDIAETLGKKRGSIRFLLSAMRGDDEIVETDGKYNVAQGQGGMLE